jgi:hypothetical protein
MTGVSTLHIGGGFAAADFLRTPASVVVGRAPRIVRDRPSGLKGRYAIATRRPPAALDPGASAVPGASSTGRREPAPVGARRTYIVQVPGTRPGTAQDQKTFKIKVSTVSGEGQRRVVTVAVASGVIRCLRPLPRQDTCGPVPR